MAQIMRVEACNWLASDPTFTNHREELSFPQATIAISENRGFLWGVEEIQEKVPELIWAGGFDHAFKAAAYCRDHPVDTVILDADQNGIRAVEIARIIREVDKDIHLIFCSNHKKDALEALAMNVIDYHLKPLTVEKLERSLKWAQKNDRSLYQHLCSRSSVVYAGILPFDEGAQQTAQIKAHGRRVARLSLLVAQKAYELGLSKEDEAAYSSCIEDLQEIIAMHDVGKEQILQRLKGLRKLKNLNQLKKEHRLVLMQHVKKGFLSLMETSEKFVKKKSEKYRLAAYVALCHHERWDGKGYPMGLSQREIPFAARVCGLCNAYDNMVVQNGLSESAAIKKIGQDAGKKYDPMLAEIFAVNIAPAIMRQKRR